MLYHHRSGPLLTLAAFLLSSTALAQESDGQPTLTNDVPATDARLESRDDDVMLPPIKVTGKAASEADLAPDFRATRSSSAANVDAPLLEVPATVNVLTQDFLDAIAARSVEGAIQYVPGASVENAGDPFSPKFNLRGFTVNSLQSGGVYVDGYQATRRGYHFDSSLYERLDILKGTSAVMYGLATPGGVVNYVAKKPQFEASQEVVLTLGSFDLTRGSVDLTGPIDEQKTLAYRVILTKQEANQTVSGVNSDRSFDDRLIFSPSLTWLTPTGGQVFASYEYSKVESVFDPGVKRLNSGEILFGTGPFVGPASGFDREFHSGKLEWSQPLNDDWALLVGGVVTRSDNVSDIDASYFGNLDGNPMTRWTARSIEDYEQTELRAELAGQFNTGGSVRHNLKVGANYLESEVSVDRASVSTPGVIDPFNPVFGPAPVLGEPVPSFTIGSDPEKSLYIQDYVAIMEQLKVFAGARYTEFEIFRVHATASDYRHEDNVVDWNAGAIYNHSALINPFFSYSTSTEPQRTVKEPMEGEQIELGLKSEWLDGQLATTLSVFQIEQSDIAEEVPANSGQFVLVGDQRTRGFELEAVGQVTPQLSVIGGYSYLDAEFAESTTGNEGKAPHSVPKHKVAIFGEYAFVGDLLGWRAGLGLIHVGDRFGDNANTFDLPSYERVDLSLAYEQGPLDFRATVENVFDEDYIAGSGGNGHTLSQGAPRFFTLSAGYSF